MTFRGAHFPKHDSSKQWDSADLSVKTCQEWKQAPQTQSLEASTRGHSCWGWWLPTFFMFFQDRPERTKETWLLYVTECRYYFNLCCQASC